MNKISNVWVFSDTTDKMAELMTAGLTLGEKVFAIVLGSENDVKNAYALGANEVYYIGEKEPNKIIENYSSTIAKIISTIDNSLVLLPSTRLSKSLASILGVKLDAGVITEATNICVENSKVVCKHMVYGGLALSEEKINSNISIIVLGNGIYEPAEIDLSKTGKAIECELIPDTRTLKCLERKPKEGSSVDLNKAKRIVSIGRGVAREEDIASIKDMSKILNAELGCSRPIAEGEKWMEQARYIGISGVMPKPEVYLALGISGQIQHMVGAKESQIIIAVNKDKNAPIFQYADYGIVGDLYKVVPAIAETFKK